MKIESERLEPTGWGVANTDAGQSLVHIHTVADRKVKVLKADGTEGEAMLSQVQAKLLTDANVPFAYAAGEIVRSVRDEEINARRRARLPDLCERPGCARELSMTHDALRKRSLLSHPWLCFTCARRGRDVPAVPAAIAARRKAGLPDLCEGDGCGRSLGSHPHVMNQRDRRPHPWLCARCARGRRGIPLNQEAIATCDATGCGRALGMSSSSVGARRGKPGPHLCRVCALRARAARRPIPKEKIAAQPEPCQRCGAALGMSRCAVDKRRKTGSSVCQRCSTPPEATAKAREARIARRRLAQSAKRRRHDQ